MLTIATILLALSTAAAWRYFKARNQSDGRDQRTISQTAGFFIVMVLVILLPIKRMISDQNTRDIVITLISIVSIVAFKLGEITLRKAQQSR